MPLIRCPVCGDRHRVNHYEMGQDFICQNSANRVNQKTFQNVVPEDQLEKGNYPMNRSSVLENEARPATVLTDKADFRLSGDPLGTLRKNY